MGSSNLRLSEKFQKALDATSSLIQSTPGLKYLNGCENQENKKRNDWIQKHKYAKSIEAGMLVEKTSMWTRTKDHVFPSQETMDVFNKLRSSVTSKVTQLSSQVSSVLPGNPVTREFDALDHIASAGPGLLWKVYSGNKRSTKQEASIFVFEKRELENYHRGDRETILENMRKGVAQLTRLRHPNVITVQHPLEESRESLAFATEPVLASLANVLGNHANLPTPPPQILKGFSLFDVEIKYGIMQLSEGLAFLHNDVKMIHRAIAPENVVLNKSGSWKVFGFDFALHNSSMEGQEPSWNCVPLERGAHPHSQPNLDYLAPEFALGTTITPASDMYSLGALICFVLRKGKPLFECMGELDSFKRNALQLSELKQSNLCFVPEPLREYVFLLLNSSAELRPDAHQMSKLPYFEDVGVKTLSYLDSLYQWDNLQKSQFYKGLPKTLTTLPQRVNLFRVLPCLVKEFANPPMIPFVLGSVLMIAEDATDQEFVSYVLPPLRPVMAIKEPIQVLLLFLQRMELLLKKTPAADIREHVLPMVYRSLECDATQIVELSLSIIPSCISLLDYGATKNALLPRLKALAVKTPSLSVRVNVLVCLGKILPHLDKWLVMDEILVWLPQIPSKEPPVLMGIIGILKLALETEKLGITKEVLATRVLPFVIPLLIENGYTERQFETVAKLVSKMLDVVVGEHRTKISQLNSLRQEQHSTIENTLSATGRNELIPGTVASSGNEADAFFSSLGLEGFGGPKDIQKVAASLNAKRAEVDSTPGKASYVNGSNPSTPVDAKTGLSLEEKQRLARERLSSSSVPSTPSTSLNPLPPPLSQPAKRDLTSSLIESNLKMMSHKLPSPGPQPPFSPHTQLSQFGQPMLQWNAPSTTQPSWGHSVQQTTWGPNGSLQQQQMSSPRALNMSSLDSLLPLNKGNRPSLNALAASPRNDALAWPTPTSAPTQAANLTSADITDLLS
ncbi:unnamed protein product [Cyprideis torosa]|uniref:Uncharacterized protein n=1 Tax=Cyprideis torosa TaxID=163714 RepID=A0A7R8ZVY1_9CRUS|nr:unnamed protein product [Cyprideis torosa]CAG0904334.1 unnamed protein product [Cyprideis torosa]